MTFKRYQQYQSTGLDWLPSIPAHWAIRRLKDHAALVGGAGFPHEYQGLEDEDLPFYKVGDLSVATDGKTMQRAPHSISRPTASKLRAPVIPPGAIVYAKIGAALLLNRRRITTTACCIDNNMTALVPDRRVLSTEWAYYWTSTLDFGEFANPGAIPSLSEIYQSTLPLALPPINEQRAITTFLDAQTTRIDTLVAKKRDLIEKLKEKRAALISRTVTRGLPPEAARAAGLDPHSRLKPSGVEWLGDMPEHWEVKPIKAVAIVGNGSTPSRENPDYWAGDYPWLNSSVVNQDNVVAASECVTETALRECHLPRIQPPAVLVGITGEGKTRGMATTLRIEATINQHLAYLKPMGEHYAVGYLRHVMDHAYSYLRSESSGGGSTKGAITCEQLASLKIPSPPALEQVAIADYLSRGTDAVDDLTAKVNEAIERLREYRSALIAATVTGKIDVRSHVAETVAQMPEAVA